MHARMQQDPLGGAERADTHELANISSARLTSVVIGSPITEARSDFALKGRADFDTQRGACGSSSA